MSRLSREATDVRGATRTSILHQLNVRVLDIVLGSWWERCEKFQAGSVAGRVLGQVPGAAPVLLVCLRNERSHQPAHPPVAPKRPDGSNEAPRILSETPAA